MIIKILSCLITVFLIFCFPNFVKAEGEFSTSYDVNYEVLQSGDTLVTEKIVLKNLTDKHYASSFTLTIGATDIRDVEAQDKNGKLETEIIPLGSKTEILIKFKEQVSGLNKEYPWTLTFKTKDVAELQGKVWQVSVPKIASVKNMDKYNLILTVPVSFGDPSTILPEPVSVNESGGKVNLVYSKEQLINTGILANFGIEQIIDYELTYYLKNSSILPKVAGVSLPANTAYQQVLINSIEPKPENVVIDEDGNYIAYFKVNSNQNIEAKVFGMAKLFNSSKQKVQQLTNEEIKTFTSNQKYWESDSPLVKSKLEEIFKNKNPKTNQEKAILINEYVVNILQFDNKNTERLGGQTALNNPTKSTCKEFSDLFITLSRSAGVPARMLLGYAYTSNKSIRPLCVSDNLHVWPEYYDSALGWVMIDPTWQNTTGGVDYFTKLDLNHFVLTTRGMSSEEPITADLANVNFSNLEFNAKPQLKLNLLSPGSLLAGFPGIANVEISNLGNSLFPSTNFNFSSSKIDIVYEDFDYSTQKSFGTKPLPPYGSQKYKFNLRTKSVWESYDDVLKLSVADQSIQKIISVKPFFAFKTFSVSVSAIIFLIILSYFVVLFLHLKQNTKNIKKTHTKHKK